MLKRRVHIAGVSDIHNFGDALFPVIAARRLAPFGYEVVPVSPTGAALTWSDALRSMPIDRLLSPEEPSDGILVGGGHIILGDTPAQLFSSRFAYDASSIPSLWLGASLIAALRDLPIAWNAPGVFGPMAGPELRAATAAAMDLAGHLAVRDARSRALLAPSSDQVAVLPDTALEVSALWPRRHLNDTFKQLLDRKGLDGTRPLFALHLRRLERSDTAILALTAQITLFAEATGLVPALVAIGPAAGDADVLRLVSRCLGIRHLLLDDPVGLREIAALLAHAALFVGQSLHGYIAAASYGVPGILIARSPARRFRGFLEQFGRPGDFSSDWEGAFSRAKVLLREPAGNRLPTAILDGLDQHWSGIATCLGQGRCAGAEARLAFLRCYAQLGHRRAGTAWSFRPVASREYNIGNETDAVTGRSSYAP